MLKEALSPQGAIHPQKKQYQRYHLCHKFHLKTFTQSILKAKTLIFQELLLIKSKNCDKIKKWKIAIFRLGMSQRRKGLKLKRMTMAFSDMNYDFMRTYARQKGITATQLMNDLLSEIRKAVYKY